MTAELGIVMADEGYPQNGRHSSSSNALTPGFQISAMNKHAYSSVRKM